VDDWPAEVDPLRAGLTDEAFADLLDQESWTPAEVDLLRATGMRVISPEEARAAFIPPDQLRPTCGYVVWEPATGKHLVPAPFAHHRHARLEDELEAGILTSMPPDTPLPFWLVMSRPVAVFFGQELLDALKLPGLDFPDAWGDVDEELLDMAAAAHLTIGPHQLLLPLTYMRGSLARDLVMRPLRPLADWADAYPDLVPVQLGGREAVASKLASWNFQMQRGSTAQPFWKALWLPPRTMPQRRGKKGRPSEEEVQETAQQVVSALQDVGFFEEHELHPWVDAWSLAWAPMRRPEAWADSEFQGLLRQ
jgi:hypothetical protein